MSRTLIPCAYRLMIMSSRPPATRPARLGTSSGSNVPARSRGTARRHRPDPGLHCLGDRAVPVVPRPGRPFPAVPVVAQVRGQLGLQGPFQHRLDQLAEHRALAGQPQPPGLVAGPVQQRVQQPVIHQLPQRHPVRLLQARKRVFPVAADRPRHLRSRRSVTGHGPCDPPDCRHFR